MPNARISPEIVGMKEMVRKTLECRDIALFVDIHGHSRQKNVFMYGCQNVAPRIFSEKNRFSNQHKEKVFPLLMSRQSEVFNFSDCSFAV